MIQKHAHKAKPRRRAPPIPQAPLDAYAATQKSAIERLSSKMQLQTTGNAPWRPDPGPYVPPELKNQWDALVSAVLMSPSTEFAAAALAFAESQRPQMQPTSQDAQTGKS